MTREMKSYFNLTETPFTKDIKTDSLSLLPSLEKISGALKLLVDTRGIGVMTGKPGTGKSCLLRLLISNLNPGLYKPLYICHSSTSLLEFYGHLAVQLGLEPRHRRGAMFQDINERIVSLNNSSRIHPVLIIDEAHLLRNEILQEIRLLTNFEIDSYSGLTVLLCGQESLNMKFGLSILESLANSITITVSVEGLKEEETFAYIEDRLTVLGSSKPLFTKNALKLIHQVSGGIMRNINRVATQQF